ncbi:MAG: nicotinate phosphoribosyltransferase, partial [Candidatus Dormiibacterota bacterium]
LDELEIDDLVRAGAPIDAFGIGTRMGVSADHPYLDTAYKLVRYADRPVMKLSRGKVTAPGRKQVFRRRRPFGDMVGLFDEAAPARHQPLLEPLMIGGRRSNAHAAVAESRRRFEEDLSILPVAARDLRSPQPPSVRFSPELRQLSAETRRELTSKLRPHGHRTGNLKT